MAVPSRRVTTGAALLACSVIQAGCSSAVSDPAPFAAGRYQQPARFDDIYRNRAPDVVRYDRYTLVSTRPDDAQRDPLNQIIDITMPAQLVNTVGEGFRYLLLESGYSLCSARTSAFSELLSHPLPAVQRDIGPVRLSEALQIVAGPAWRLRVDDVNREICFELRDPYRRFAAPLPVHVALASQHASVSLPPVIPSAQTAGAASTVNAVPRNPFTGDTRLNSTQGSGQKLVLTPQSLAVPSPLLTVAKTPAKAPAAQKSDALSPAGSPSVPPPAAAPKAASSQKTPVITVHPVTAQPITVNAARQTVPVRPVTSLPPAPPVSSQTATSYIPGTPVTPLPVGQTWRAEPGSTLKETLTGWASKATCSNGGNWVVIWPVSLDYRIDAPLVFHGNFESVLVQVFDLYRKAEKPLFAEANRIQCLISVSDTPAGGGH